MLEDLLLLNCRVITMDLARPRGTALALRAGRILAVGDEEEVRAAAGPRAVTLDCDRAVLAPAFHDAHVHLAQHGFELSQVSLHDAPDLGEGLRRVAERAASMPAGSWILGAGYALQRWGLETLERAQLDRVAPDHPVLLRSQDHHSAWVNSRALEYAGVHASTPEPEDGTVVRNEHGIPTGMLLERALHLVWDRVPPADRVEIEAAVERAAVDLAACGIATVHHMAYEPGSYWREIALRASQGDFPLRVWACVDQEDIEHAAALGLATGQGGANFTIGGAKFFADGALGSRTAWMLEAYAGTGDHGVAVHGPEVLAERYPLAIEAGLAPVTHAIGDAAVRAVVDALESAGPAWRERGLRPRIEHAQHVAREEVERIAELGIVVSMQPTHLTFDVPSIRALLPDRLERAYPIASLLAAGARVAFGSDTPVARPDVIAGMRAARTRIGSDGSVLCGDQAVTAEQALVAYTRDAAYAIGREGRSGVLAPGCDADVVMLSADPLESVDELRVRGTLKAGRPTFDPEGLLVPGI